MRIPENIVQQIKDTADADLVGVLSEFLALKKNGQTYKAKSPFTTEKTPSFIVSPKKQIWKCFSSGHGGRGAISFLMEAQGMAFLDAVHFLANKYGISIPENPDQSQNTEAYDRHRKACELFETNLGDNKDALAYLKGRGYTNETIKKFKIGYSTKKPFIERLIFPIISQGKVVAFGGRTLDKDFKEKDIPKYVNSQESEIYNKSQVLYGLHYARFAMRQENKCILTEGYTDVISLHQAGIEHTVGTCGTALTEEQAKLIQRYTNNILIARDSDQAGIKATLRDIDILVGCGFSVKVLLLPEKEDPDSYVREEGAKGFQLYAEKHAQDAIGFVIDQMGEANEPSEKSAILKRVGELIASMPFEEEQQLYVEHVAERMKVKPNLVARFAKVLQDVYPSGVSHRPGVRTWEAYKTMIEAANIPECEDFERADDGAIEISYFNIKGKPHTRKVNKQTIEVKRITSASYQPSGVYIPPALRKLADAEVLNAIKLGQLPLVIVKDEVAAHCLCELGLPAVGICERNAWLSNSNTPTLHPLLREVIEIGFKRLIYVLPEQCLSLPKEHKPNNIEIDAAKHPSLFLNTLISFEKSTRDYQTFVLSKGGEIEPEREHHWIDDFITSKACAEGIVEIRQKLVQSEYKPTHINMAEMTASTPQRLRILLRIDSPIRFYKTHGREFLGLSFRFGKKVYDISPTGDPILKDDDEPAPEVWTSGKVMKCRAKGEGVKRISNFVIKCELEIKEMDDSFGIYVFENDLNQKCRTIISDSDFLSLTSFNKKVRALPGKFFPKLTSTHLPEIQEMTNLDADLANTLGHKLGMYTPMPDVEGNVPPQFFVWGNGVSTISGEFVTSDENGVLELDQRKYFLPANCNFLAMRPGHVEKYQKNYMMTYEASGISFKKWFAQFALVNGEKHAHISFQFALSSLYIDIIGKKFGRFPLYYVQGRRGSGKGTMIEGLSRLFGTGGITDKSEGLDIMNLESDNTLASIFYHPTQVKNALCVYNEFNVSTITKKMPKVLEFFKGIYDRQGRKRMSGSNTKETEEAAIEGVVIFMGQEPIFKRDELDSRCIIDEFPDRDAPTEIETKRLYDLNELEQNGLCHLVSEFFALRPIIEQNIGGYVREIEMQLKQAGHEIAGAPARLFQNWALLLSPVFILMDKSKIDYPLSKKALLELAIENIQNHVNNTREQGKAGLFFQFIEESIMKNFGGVDDRVVYVDYEADELRIQFRNAYNQFDSWLNATRRADSLQNTTMKDIQSYLEAHPAYLKTEKKNLHIGYKRNQEGKIAYRELKDGLSPKKNLTSGMIFRYSLLDIDIQQTDFSFEPDRIENEPMPQAAPVNEQQVNGKQMPLLKVERDSMKYNNPENI